MATDLQRFTSTVAGVFFIALLNTAILEGNTAKRDCR